MTASTRRASGRRHSRAAGLIAGLIVSLAIGVAPLSAAAASRIDGWGGMMVFFEANTRDAFGASPTTGLGWSMPTSESADFFAELGYWRASGHLFPDPTFETKRSLVELVPIVVGMRANLMHASQSSTRLLLGFGWQTVAVHWSGDLQEAETDWMFGLQVEIRPEFHLGERWLAWVRQRVSFLTKPHFGARPDLSFSNIGLEGGLTYRFH